jgi:hypothetical protein
MPPLQLGLARTLCIYGILGREIIEYTVRNGAYVYTRYYPAYNLK